MHRGAITVIVGSLLGFYWLFVGFGKETTVGVPSPQTLPFASASRSSQVKGRKEIEEMNAFRAVFVTVPNIEVGKKIAQGLVTNKLAACVNIIPQVISVYEWEGKINEDSELILMIKSQEHLFADLEKFVKENHPYDVPEVISLPIQQGSKAYLDWISSVTRKN